MVQIVFQYPRSFSINTRRRLFLLPVPIAYSRYISISAGSGEDSTLVSMVKPLSIKTDTRALKVKSATETNLAWIGHAPFILEVCKFTKVNCVSDSNRRVVILGIHSLHDVEKITAGLDILGKREKCTLFAVKPIHLVGYSPCFANIVVSAISMLRAIFGMCRY